MDIRFKLIVNCLIDETSWESRTTLHTKTQSSIQEGLEKIRKSLSKDQQQDFVHCSYTVVPIVLINSHEFFLIPEQDICISSSKNLRWIKVNE